MTNYLYENFFDHDTNALNGRKILRRVLHEAAAGNMTISDGKGEMAGLILATYSRDYQFNNFTNQWDPFIEHTRGIVLDVATRDINECPVVALGLIKLFNYGEGEIHYPSPDATIVGCVEKVDGSLGLLFHHNGAWKLTTRGGLNSDIAAYGKKILDRQLVGDYSRFDPQYTYLFEIVYPDNQIVVDYGGKEELVYIARRCNQTGTLIYHHNDDIVLHSGIRFARTMPPPNTIEQVREFNNTMRGADFEGTVTHFSDGSAFKVKGEDYLRIHRAKSKLTFNRVLESIQSEQSHAYKLSLEEELWPEYDRIHDDIMQQVAQHQRNIDLWYKTVCLAQDRKQFALAVQQSTLIPQGYKRFMFLKLDGKLTVAKMVEMLDIKPTKNRAYIDQE